MSMQHDEHRPMTDPDPTRNTPPVVVGVDGSIRNTSAIEWAAVEAARSNCELRLLTTTGVFTEPHPQRILGVIESFDYGARLHPDVGESRE